VDGGFELLGMTVIIAAIGWLTTTTRDGNAEMLGTAGMMVRCLGDEDGRIERPAVGRWIAPAGERARRRS
jgi:hypothetical protein